MIINQFKNNNHPNLSIKIKINKDVASKDQDPQLNYIKDQYNNKSESNKDNNPHK